MILCIIVWLFFWMNCQLFLIESFFIMRRSSNNHAGWIPFWSKSSKSSTASSSDHSRRSISRLMHRIAFSDAWFKARPVLESELFLITSPRLNCALKSSGAVSPACRNSESGRVPLRLATKAHSFTNPPVSTWMWEVNMGSASSRTGCNSRKCSAKDSSKGTKEFIGKSLCLPASALLASTWRHNAQGSLVCELYSDHWVWWGLDDVTQAFRACKRKDRTGGTVWWIQRASCFKGVEGSELSPKLLGQAMASLLPLKRESGRYSTHAVFLSLLLLLHGCSRNNLRM